MARLYARRIHTRAITILDVPRDLWDAVMALLDDADRERMRRFIDGEGA